MNSMFILATSFKQKLCGASWVHSTASKDYMFSGSSGSISLTVCADAISYTPIVDVRRVIKAIYMTSTTTQATASIVTPTTSPASIHTITRTRKPTSTDAVLTCSKCGTFKKSGRVSCCAPGGSWYRNCGGAGNRNVGYIWSDGVKACTRKFKTNAMQIYHHCHG